jgi:hypothetical protein
VSESGRSIELPAQRFQLDAKSKRWSVVGDSVGDEASADDDPAVASDA